MECSFDKASSGCQLTVAKNTLTLLRARHCTPTTVPRALWTILEHQHLHGLWGEEVPQWWEPFVFSPRRFSSEQAHSTAQVPTDSDTFNSELVQIPQETSQAAVVSEISYLCNTWNAEIMPLNKIKNKIQKCIQTLKGKLCCNVNPFADVAVKFFFCQAQS